MRNIRSAVAISQILVVLLALGACAPDEAPPAGGTSPGNPASGLSQDAALDNIDATEGLAVVAESLPYAEVDDELVYGYFAFPANMVDSLPAVLVVHDRWGLNDDVRASVERLAAGGYIVLGK